MRPPVSAKTAVATLGLTLAIQSFGSAAVIAPTAVAPLLLGELGLPPASVGVYIALVYLGAMIASVVGSHVVVHHGPIRASQYALAGCAAGLLALCVGSVAGAIAGAVLVGLGYGPITPASSQVLARTTPAQRIGLVFSLKQTGVPLGGVLAGLVAPPLAVAGGWRLALLVIVAGCVACALLAQRLRAALDTDLPPSGRWPGPRVLLRPVAMVWRHPTMRVLAGCSFVFSAVQVSLTSFAVTFLTEGLAWPLVAAGVALSVSQSGGVVGRVLWGWIADRGPGPRRVLLGLCATMMAAGVAMMLPGPQTAPALVLAGLAVYGATAIGWNGVFLALVARLAPRGEAGVATGGTLAFTYLGVVGGPPLFGAIASAGPGYGIAFALTAVPLAACMIALRRVHIG